MGTKFSVERIMKVWQGQEYFDDRMFILQLRQAKKSGKNVWAVLTRRNVEGYPTRRVDDFDSKEKATSFIKQVEPLTPRISLGGEAPSTVLTYEEFLSWCENNNISSSLELHRASRHSITLKLVCQKTKSMRLWDDFTLLEIVGGIRKPNSRIHTVHQPLRETPL